MDDLISRQAAIDALDTGLWGVEWDKALATAMLKDLPPVQPEDYAELKRVFILMASYIDAILRCSDEQKETLNWFISRLAKFMPWKERD